MKPSKKIWALLLGAAALVSLPISSAYALNDDEAAVLVGLAVGGLTAYAVKHHRERDHNDWQYSQQRRYVHPGSHNRHGDRCRQRAPTRVEHYVIHNPPGHSRQSHYRGRHSSDYRSHGGGNYRARYYQHRSNGNRSAGHSHQQHRGGVPF